LKSVGAIDQTLFWPWVLLLEGDVARYGKAQHMKTRDVFCSKKAAALTVPYFSLQRNKTLKHSEISHTVTTVLTVILFSWKINFLQH